MTHATDAQFNDDEGKAVLALVEGLAWGNMDSSIFDLELTLSLLLQATESFADDWDERDGAMPWGDEYSVPPEDVAAMTPSSRLEYVGRLVRSLALHYGIGDGRPQRLLEAQPNSPAALLRGINDISWRVV